MAAHHPLPMQTALSLPNILTYLRILAVPLVAASFYIEGDGGRWLAFGLFAFASVTDYFDGYLARAQGTVSKLGVFLDPIADKIMVAAVLMMLVATRDIEGWHVIAAIIILLREITVSGLREFLAGLQISVPVSRLAKWKTALQMIALGGLILDGVLREWQVVHIASLTCLWAAALLTLVTGWDYLRAGLKHMA